MRDLDKAVAGLCHPGSFCGGSLADPGDPAAWFRVTAAQVRAALIDARDEALEAAAYACRAVEDLKTANAELRRENDRLESQLRVEKARDRCGNVGLPARYAAS